MRRLFQIFTQAGKELYLVGGAVRDLAMGIPYQDLKDLDFATDASPKETQRILHEGGFGTYRTGWAFGTVGTILRDRIDGVEECGREGCVSRDVQITTYRTYEYYTPGSRKPQVKFGKSLEQDLSRRDFAMNSIAMGEDGKIIDPFGGMEDIQLKRIRIVGDPEQTLREDPLRILRVARFISQLGFTPVEDVEKAANLAAAMILDVSRERWFLEMNKLLMGQDVTSALEFLYRSRVLGFILPECAAMVGFDQTSEFHHKDVWEHTKQVTHQCPRTLELRWTGLLHDTGKVWTRETTPDGKVHFFRHEDMGVLLFDGIGERFHFDNILRRKVHFLIKHHLRANLYDGTWTDSAVRRFIADMGEHLHDLLMFARADITSGSQFRRDKGKRLIDELQQRCEAIIEEDGKEPLLPKGIGKQIMDAFSLPPGPQIGELRTLIENAIIEGLIKPGLPMEEYITYLRDNATVTAASESPEESE